MLASCFNDVCCPFWIKCQILAARPPRPMRKVVDPSWECGLGFGSVKRRRTDLVLPWEEPVFSFLAQDTNFLQDLQEKLLEQPEPVPLPTPVAAKALVQQTSLRPPQPKLRSVTQWKPQDSQAERQAALSKWSQLLRAVPHLFPEETQLEIVHEDNQVELGNLDLRFAKKSTNTLLSRVSSLQRFAAWKLKCFPHEPLSESVVFLYCEHLKQKQPDSSAALSSLELHRRSPRPAGTCADLSQFQSTRSGASVHAPAEAAETGATLDHRSGSVASDVCSVG